jgi:hypothetical protein
MKTFENLNMINSFTPYLFFTNQVKWNQFIPKHFRIEGNSENIYLQFFGMRGSGTSTSGDLVFTPEEFLKFVKDKKGIIKDVHSELSVKLFRKMPDGKMNPINENELTDLKLELGYELHHIEN